MKSNSSTSSSHTKSNLYLMKLLRSLLLVAQILESPVLSLYTVRRFFSPLLSLASLNHSPTTGAEHAAVEQSRVRIKRRRCIGSFCYGHRPWFAMPIAADRSVVEDHGAGCITVAG